MEYRLEVGVAREIITPPVGSRLYGYNDHTVSTALHDDLTVTALAVRQGEVSALLLSVTLCEMEGELQQKIRETISAQTGVPADNILFSCTHTHCGPNLCGTTGCGPVDWDYYNTIFLPRVQKAAQNALAAMVPAEYAVGETESRVGINRRDMLADGTYRMGQNPYALFDPTLTAVTFRHADTKEEFFCLLHYGCHGTAAGNCDIITRDWSGLMTDRVEAETSMLAAYWNGSEGDVGPRLENGETVGNILDVEKLGAIAGEDALRALQARGAYRTGDLQVVSGKLKVPYLAPPPVEEMKAKLAELENNRGDGVLGYIVYTFYERLLQMVTDNEPMPTHFVVPQTLVSLGDVLFVPYPFEVFAETVLRLRRFIPKPHVLCLSVTNGFEHYLPTESDICRGGYEVDCLLYGHLLPMPRNTEQLLINATLELAKKL